jgi:hypothetical protein
VNKEDDEPLSSSIYFTEDERFLRTLETKVSAIIPYHSTTKFISIFAKVIACNEIILTKGRYGKLQGY